MLYIRYFFPSFWLAEKFKNTKKKKEKKRFNFVSNNPLQRSPSERRYRVRFNRGNEPTLMIT